MPRRINAGDRARFIIWQIPESGVLFSFRMDFSQLRELESQSARPRSCETDTQLTGIVKVTTAGYRPSQVRVRSVIGSHIFTADFSAADLSAIESDPQVEAVALSQPLPLQKLPQP
jgi:hypothetical protein